MLLDKRQNRQRFWTEWQQPLHKLRVLIHLYWVYSNTLSIAAIIIVQRRVTGFPEHNKLKRAWKEAAVA
jgi:hypothetical protein